MTALSSGLLLYRRRDQRLEVFLVHPGGPFWAKRDRGAWSIPKGEVAPGEDSLAAAFREFEEETGIRLSGNGMALAPVRQAGGKTVLAWALEADCDPDQVVSNRFEMEWPPRSGRRQSFPEVDRAAWFQVADAEERILPGQRPLLVELVQKLEEASH